MKRNLIAASDRHTLRARELRTSVTNRHLMGVAARISIAASTRDCGTEDSPRTPNCSMPAVLAVSTHLPETFGCVMARSIRWRVDEVASRFVLVPLQ
jgi:hypothetical protein